MYVYMYVIILRSGPLTERCARSKSRLRSRKGIRPMALGLEFLDISGSSRKEVRCEMLTLDFCPSWSIASQSHHIP